MVIIDSHYLADERGQAPERPAHLIHVERPEDLDTLLQNIVSTGYYDRAYFESHSGQRDDRKIPHFWFVAELVRTLMPRSVVDVGCGRGDVLWFLQRHGVEVTGIDFSADAEQCTWPELKGHLVLGELRATCERLGEQGRRFDTLCGFDIWEHLHPRELVPSLEALVRLATDDALLLFVVPAFGRDRVFGELFPLEFEENRAAFDRRQPFEYLLAERLDPPIPAAGHLIWAHTEWWEERFRGLGLQREVELEQGIHAAFDRYLPDSVRAFYVLSRGARAAARVERLRRTYAGGRRQVALHIHAVEDLARGVLAIRGEAPEVMNRLVGSAVPRPIRRLVKRTLKRILSRG